MGRQGQSAACRAGYFARVVLATLVVTVLPGLVAAALQATGVIHGWLPSAGIAVVLSMALAAVGSVWWARRPASRDIVFADLMLWGWLRRVRTERRLASARGLLGRSADLDPARKAALLERLSSALESRDLHTHGHSRRVTRHSYRIARRLGLSAAEAARIRTAAALHDVGKMETPREVLNKPARLSDEEFATIKRHPVDGARMVAALGDDELTAMVRHHHERLDGGGYPDGLVGGAIPLGARVIAVADTFDALTSNRPYRTGCRHKKALDILRAGAGTQLDPDVVAAFLSYYSGRRALPWWSAVAEAPGRLATWALSGIQGATAAPLSSGAGSLGAAFLVGATLAGTPATGEASRSVKASADVAFASASGGSASDRRRPREASGRATGPGTSEAAGGEGDAPRGESRGGRGNGERLLRDGPASGAPAGEEAAEVQSHAGTDSGGGSGGGGDTGAAGIGGGGSGGGDRGLKLPDVATEPADTPVADTDDRDNADRPIGISTPKSDLSEDDAPDLEQRRVELPKVKVKGEPKVKDVPKVKVDVPKVEPPKATVPGVELPMVEPPPVEVDVGLPPMEVPKAPKVQRPKVEVKVPRLRLP
ncbi:MAG TPA: HD-GYP domain-containing protein [Thermoleophilaceae bacterium]|nr:HD-GYP domain-containing protein [Thermoleophilaceae bacterium]